VLYSRSTDNAENTVLLLRNAYHTENISHVIAKHCWDVISLRLPGSVFTQPNLEAGCITPLFHCCLRVLLINDCFCGSNILACNKHATILYIASNCETLDDTGKDVKWKWPWSNPGTISAFAWRDPEKPREISLRTIGILAEIWTGYRYHHSQFPRSYIRSLDLEEIASSEKTRMSLHLRFFISTCVISSYLTYCIS
jgi:hypothetical protein